MIERTLTISTMIKTEMLRKSFRKFYDIHIKEIYRIHERNCLLFSAQIYESALVDMTAAFVNIFTVNT